MTLIWNENKGITASVIQCGGGMYSKKHFNIAIMNWFLMGGFFDPIVTPGAEELWSGPIKGVLSLSANYKTQLSVGRGDVSAPRWTRPRQGYKSAASGACPYNQGAGPSTETRTHTHVHWHTHKHTLLKDFPMGLIHLTLLHKLTCDLLFKLVQEGLSSVLKLTNTPQKD